MNNKTKWDYVGMTEKEIRNEHDSYYVYLHIHIPSNKVLYCGKGSRRRCVSFNRRPYYNEYLEGNIEVEILKRFDNQDEALEYEEQEIFYLKYINHCEYNNLQFYEGKKRIEGEKEVAIDTIEICDTQEVIYENEYESNRKFKDYLNSMQIKNIYLPSFMLNMIRDKEIRDNTERFLNSLEDMEVEELYDLYTLYEQLLHERINEIAKEEIYSTRIIYRYLRKIFK